MRIGPIARIALFSGVILSLSAPALAQGYYYGSGVYYIPVQTHHDYWDDGSCVPYRPMPFSYINGCDEYIPSFDDWRSPGRG